MASKKKKSTKRSTTLMSLSFSWPRRKKNKSPRQKKSSRGSPRGKKDKRGRRTNGEIYKPFPSLDSSPARLSLATGSPRSRSKATQFGGSVRVRDTHSFPRLNRTHKRLNTAPARSDMQERHTISVFGQYRQPEEVFELVEQYFSTLRTNAKHLVAHALKLRELIGKDGQEIQKEFEEKAHKLVELVKFVKDTALQLYRIKIADVELSRLQGKLLRLALNVTDNAILFVRRAKTVCFGDPSASIDDKFSTSVLQLANSIKELLSTGQKLHQDTSGWWGTKFGKEEAASYDARDSRTLGNRPVRRKGRVTSERVRTKAKTNGPVDRSSFKSFSSAQTGGHQYDEMTKGSSTRSSRALSELESLQTDLEHFAAE